MITFKVKVSQLRQLMQGLNGRWPVPPLVREARLIIIDDTEPAQGWVTPRQPCTGHARGATFLLICVLDDGHDGRHTDADGGTWTGYNEGD